MIANFLSYGNLLIIAFLGFVALECFVTYACSNSALKVLEKTNSYAKAISRIRIYDQYILTNLTIISSSIYVFVSYFYYVDLLNVSDYFLPLSILTGFIFSLVTTFFARLCYCYACNVLLKTKLNEYDVFKENFFYLIRIFLPIFIISYAIPTLDLIPVSMTYRKIITIAFILIFLFIWTLLSPFKTILTLNAKKIRNEDLEAQLSSLFENNNIKNYKLYYWDSSRSNDANAMVSGFFSNYLFVSSSLIEMLSKRELEAVVLHEIGHVKNHHASRILVWKLVLLISISLLFFYLSSSFKFNIYILMGLIFLFFVTIGFNLKGSKKYEDQADLYVNKLGYGKDLISALKKVSLEESSMNKLDEFFSSHPNINKRIDKLGKDK